MTEPYYLRRKSSDTLSNSDSDLNYTSNNNKTNCDKLITSNIESFEQINVTGLRKKRLIQLIVWLIVLSIFSIILILINFILINVLQMTTQGMQSLKINNYLNERTNEMESAVYFTASKINLGHIIVKSGKVIGAQDKTFSIFGPKINISTNSKNGTSFSLVEDICRIENANQFQIIDGTNGKIYFNANHPLVVVDQKIKKIAIRSPINEKLQFKADDINIRGNEAIQIDAKIFNATFDTTLLLKTSKDGAIKIDARRIFFGNAWRPLSLSSSPALTASIDAYRLCICTSKRPKLFVVNGNKPCIAPLTLCT